MILRDLNYWIELLFRRRNAFLETAGIIFGLVVLGTLLWPPLYQSTAKIFVQNNRAQLLVSPDLQIESSQNPGIVANPVSEQDLNSEVELLTSLHLVKQAIAGLQLPYDATGPGLLQGTVGLALQIPTTGYRLLHSSPALDPRDQWDARGFAPTAFPCLSAAASPAAPGLVTPLAVGPKRGRLSSWRPRSAGRTAV